MIPPDYTGSKLTIWVAFQQLRDQWKCSRKNFVFLFGTLINLTVRVNAYFPQSGWLILFSPDHLSGQHQIGESLPNTLSSSELFKKDRHLTVRSSIAAASPPWGKQSNLWSPCIYSLRPRVPSRRWIRWIQYATHANNLKSPSTLAMSTAMQNTAPTSSHFIPGQHFLETCFSPQTTRTTHPWVTTSFLSLTSKHDFCKPNDAHFTQAFSC